MTATRLPWYTDFCPWNLGSQTASFSATLGKYRVDPSAGPIAIALPTGVPDGWPLIFKIVGATAGALAANTVTLNAPGGQTIEQFSGVALASLALVSGIPGGTVPLIGQQFEVVYDASSLLWRIG